MFRFKFQIKPRKTETEPKNYTREHNWTPWEMSSEKRESIISFSGSTSYSVQSRHCKDCGLVEERPVSESVGERVPCPGVRD